MPSPLRSALPLAALSIALAVPLSAQTRPPAAPPGSAGHALIYHDSLRAIILVNAGLGGMQSPAASTPTTLWKWDGRGWKVIDAAGPPVRNLGGVAYDVARNALVLHGGTYSESLSYSDTWEWHPARGWRRVTATGPGTRDHTQMAYDAVRKEIVLFGGQVRIDSFPSDTWIWNGVSWRQLNAQGLSARVHHSMTFDPASGRVLIHGGNAPMDRRNLGDSWSWNGRAWEAAAPATAPRTHGVMARTPEGIATLGGFPEASGGIQLLRNGAWARVPQSGNPGGRFLSAMAYDPLRQVTVLFGGGTQSSNDLLADTWEYSTQNGWKKIREN